MSREKADQLLISGIRLAYCGLLFFTPLLMFTKASEVFEFPKMLFVYAMTVIIGGMWLARMVINRKILIAKTPLDIPVLLFLLSQGVSTFYSIEPHTSWWGYYGRFHGGLWSTICYTLLYYAFAANADKNKNIYIDSGSSRGEAGSKAGMTGAAILASATIVSIYAILQHFGIDKDYWVQDVTNRVFSTQGQPNWLAGYLVMIFPLALMFAVLSKNRVHKSFILLYCYIATLLLALLWTKSRSGLIGALTANSIFWGLALLKLQINRQFIYFHMILAGLILVTNNPAKQWIMNTTSNQIATSPYLPAGRQAPRNDITAQKSDQGTESGDIRKIVWKGAGELIRRYPLLGTGPETFAYTYWWVRPAEHNLTSEWNFLYNKAHNEWLNLAANTGLFGLGSHLLLLGWFTVWSLSSLRGGKQPAVILSEAKNPASALLISSRLLSGLDPSSQLLRMTESYSRMTIVAILAALWGVEAVNFLGFSTVTIGVYTYLFMAMAINNFQFSPPVGGFNFQFNNKLKQKISLGEIGIIGVIGIIGGYFLIQIFIMFIADLGYNRGNQFAEAGYVEEAVPILENTVQLVPDEPVFREKLGEVQALTGDVEQALKNFEVARRQNPWSIPYLRSQGKYIFSFGDLDNSLYERGIELILQSIKLAPTDPRGYYQLATFYEQLGENDLAEEMMAKTAKLKPDWEKVKQQ